MQPITPKNIESMAAIMAALNNVSEDDGNYGDVTGTYADLSESYSDTYIAPPVIPSVSDSLMPGILEAFRNATDDVIETSKSNIDVKRAIETERVTNGVRVGSWRISIREAEGHGKFYDIAHNLTDEPIASDLRLYEAALAIVNSLNEGETFTSTSIKLVLELERDYARALADAVAFSSRMKITEGVKHDILEARYSEAKRQALTAKKTIEKLTSR